MKSDLNLFTRWLIKHHSTSQDEDGSFCYKNAMGEIVEIIDIVNHYMEEQMSDKQQTAVEFLAKNLKDFPHIKHSQKFKDLVEQAKEMEKEQIIKAYQQGVTDEYSDTLDFNNDTDGEDYYNETYGGNK